MIAGIDDQRNIEVFINHLERKTLQGTGNISGTIINKLNPAHQEMIVIEFNRDYIDEKNGVTTYSQNRFERKGRKSYCWWMKEIVEGIQVILPFYKDTLYESGRHKNTFLFHYVDELFYEDDLTIAQKKLHETLLSYQRVFKKHN